MPEISSEILDKNKENMLTGGEVSFDTGIASNDVISNDISSPQVQT